MATTWTLVGTTDLTALATLLGVTITFTDGYTLAAGMTWKAIGGTVTNDNATSPNALTGTIGIGTCVELLDSAGAALAATVATVGNFAICHWMYSVFDATDDSPASYAGGSTPASEWGETRYLTATDWGTAGTGILGTTMQTLGTRLTSAANGFSLSNTAVTTFAAATVYTQTWYQPKWASTYTTTQLRRYNGGTTDGDKVKGYCVGVRSITNSSVDNVPVAGTQVTVTGATALAAGAIAFGVAALAI